MSRKTILQLAFFLLVVSGAAVTGIFQHNKNRVQPKPEPQVAPRVPLPTIAPPPLGTSLEWEGRIVQVFREGPQVEVIAMPSDPPPSAYTHCWMVESATGKQFRVEVTWKLWREARVGDWARLVSGALRPRLIKVDYRADGTPRWKHHRALAKPCPRCGSKYILDIFWGYPASEVLAEANQGEIYLGGCMMGPQSQACAACHLWW